MTRTLGISAALALVGLIFVTPAEAQRGRGGGGGGGRSGGISAGGGRSFGGGGGRSFSGGGGFSAGRSSGGFSGPRSGGGSSMGLGRPSSALGGSRMGSLGSSSGLRSPSIGSMRSPSIGSRPSPSLGNRPSPSIGRGAAGGSLGSSNLRMSPGLGSQRSTPSLGTLRSNPSPTPRSSASSLGTLRSSPALGNLRPSPELGRGTQPGRADIRSPGIAPNLLNSRPTTSASPQIGNASPTRTLPSSAASGLGDRLRSDNRLGGSTAFRDLGQSAASRLGQGAGRPGVGGGVGRDNDGRGGQSARASGPGGDSGRSIDRSPRSSITNLRPNLDGVGRGRGVGAADGVNRAIAGRVTPQNLDNFLSLRGRDGDRTRLNSLARTNIVNNNFRSLNVTQINRINNNINVGFRNQRGLGVGHFHNNWGGLNNGWGFGWRSPYWNNWAGGVRGFWNPGIYQNCFTPRFWATNYCQFPWRRSYYWWGAQPWTHWWSTPTWGNLCNWLPTYGWSDPYYYGYGPGGNIVFNSGHVFVDDTPIATIEDYAASAAELAAVPPPAEPDKPTEWLPLGTFVLSQGADDKNPRRVVQLAVDQEGIVSGTMVNQETNQTYALQGRVDKETQRVAFTIGDNREVVFETGIYNLTQQQTPVLALSGGKEETYLMLRLEEPRADGTPSAATVAESAPAASAPPIAEATAPPAPPTPADDTIPPPPPAPGAQLVPVRNSVERER